MEIKQTRESDLTRILEKNQVDSPRKLYLYYQQRRGADTTGNPCVLMGFREYMNMEGKFNLICDEFDCVPFVLWQSGKDGTEKTRLVTLNLPFLPECPWLNEICYRFADARLPWSLIESYRTLIAAMREEYRLWDARGRPYYRIEAPLGGT